MDDVGPGRALEGVEGPSSALPTGGQFRGGLVGPTIKDGGYLFGAVSVLNDLAATASDHIGPRSCWRSNDRATGLQGLRKDVPVVLSRGEQDHAVRVPQDRADLRSLSKTLILNPPVILVGGAAR